MPSEELCGTRATSQQSGQAKSSKGGTPSSRLPCPHPSSRLPCPHVHTLQAKVRGGTQFPEGPLAVARLFSAQTYPCQDRHTDKLLQASHTTPDKGRGMVLASPAMFPGHRRWYHKIHFPVERGGLTLHGHTRQGGNRGDTTCPESQTVEETRYTAVLTSSKAAGHRINPEAQQTQVKKTQHTTAVT